MATTTVLRPSATSSGVGWTAVPSGTLHGVTSDDSDSTYALWGGAGSALILATPIDSPPAGERRHLVRIRARGEDGSAWWAVRLASGALAAGAAATFPASPSTIAGSWGAGAPPDGATILSTYVTGQTSGVKIEELYIDVDTRAAPTFTPQVLDGSGASTTTVTDTATPTLHASALDLDGLSGRQFRYWVTNAGAQIVWDSGILSGAPADQSTTALANGNYTAHLIVWSTLGTSTAYSSGEETLAFSIAVGAIPVPDNPTVDQVDDTPFFTVTACAPNIGAFDDGQAWIEVERVDCVDSDSPTTTTIAVLGPLTTGQCADYIDYSLPRTGLGGSCDHEAEDCCSIYRVRTVGRVDGALQISAWSDSLDPGIPAGLTLMWAGTNASIPTGWTRATDLDGRYIKGIPTSTTEPGTTGGATSHTHTSVSHTHDISHSHTVTGNTGAATGTASAVSAGGGTTAHLSSHVHSRVTTGSTTLASGAATPVVEPVTNNLSRLEIIFIESDGTPQGAPNQSLSLINSSTPSTGWSSFTVTTNRFLKGAAAAANGGTTGASALDNHTHPLDSHPHDTVSHTHTSGNTGSTSGTNTVTAGATAVLNTTSHAHPVTVGSASSAALASGGSGTSGAAGTLQPPYRDLKIQQNTSGVPSLPVGIIGIWRDSLGSIPNHWQVADGTGGTTDMRDRYPRCVSGTPGGTGGTADTGHTHAANNHTHTTSGHSHTETVGTPTSTTTTNAATAAPNSTLALSTHTHSAADTNSTTPTVGSTTPSDTSSSGWEPAHTQVAFIQLTTPFVPQPDAVPVCLDWDDDYHLIRTTGPDGPLWANVGGIFEWDRDRPFSSAIGVNGDRFVTSAPPGARNLHMTAAVEDEAGLQALLAILQRPLVLISPSDSTEVWGAPVAASVQIVKIGRIRQVTADFIGTGPQPEPQLFDVGA